MLRGRLAIKVNENTDIRRRQETSVNLGFWCVFIFLLGCSRAQKLSDSRQSPLTRPGSSQPRHWHTQRGRRWGALRERRQSRDCPQLGSKSVGGPHL